MKIVVKKIVFIGSFLLLFLGAIFFYELAKFNDGKLHVVFCDVGQGDGILIRTPKGIDIVVDGGPDDSILSCLSSHLPFWDKTIELMILTHPHEDHLGGLIPILKRYTVLSFYTEKAQSQTRSYQALSSLLREKGLKPKFLWQGDRLVLSDRVRVQTLWPQKSFLSDDIADKDLDKNGLSIVNLLTYAKFSLLLTGDAGVVVWDRIGENLGKTDVLKVPHHGSKTALNAEILERLKPALAVISVGKKNRYGHPAAQTIKILRDLEIKVLRTDENGEVEVVSDGQSFAVVK